MKQALHRLSVETRGKGLIEITRPVLAWVSDHGIATGLLTLWCRHTSASLTVQENADPAVREDILRYFEAIAPEDPQRYVHGDEGPDDMPAHLRAMLTDAYLTEVTHDGLFAWSFMDETNMETWIIKLSNYKQVNKIITATSFEVLWRLKRGDVSYAKFTIQKIEYNNPEMF